MPRRKSNPPISYLEMNGAYPEGPFVEGTPPAVIAAAAFVQRLLFEMGHGWGAQSAMAKKAGVSQGLISRIVRGESLPDLATVANLEQALKADLWQPWSDRQGLATGANH
jgi:DNA-binding phage protein